MVKENKDGIVFGIPAALIPAAAIAALAISVNLVADWILNRTTDSREAAAMARAPSRSRATGEGGTLLDMQRPQDRGDRLSARRSAAQGHHRRRVSLRLQRGKVLGLIGESGAGKSTIGLSSMGYGRGGVKITGGEVILNGRDIMKGRHQRLAQIAW